MEIRGEVEAAEFRDRRLTARLVRLAEQLAQAPDQSFPKAAGSDAALEATYRFLGNESVSPDAILKPHVTATTERCKSAQAVVAAHDSTEFRFSSAREGLGRVAGDQTYGFIGHFALAISAAKRAPLGVVGMETVFRERGTRASGKRDRLPMVDKESRRWLDLVRQAGAVLGDVDTVIHVMDREADAYELLHAMLEEKRRFIVRLQFDRAVETTVGRGRISDVIRGRRTLLMREVTLSARRPKRREPPRRGQKHPYRTTRSATLRVSATAVTIRRPTHFGSRPLPEVLQVNVVRVQEINVPRGVDPVEWRSSPRRPLPPPRTWPRWSTATARAG